MRSAGMAKRSDKHVDNGLAVLRTPQPTSQAEGELWRMEASAVFGPCQVCLDFISMRYHSMCDGGDGEIDSSC